MARTIKIFGRKLAQARERLHMTQFELGQKLVPPVSDEAISRIENGEDDKGIYSKRLPQLAIALGMTLEDAKRELVVPGSESVTPPKGSRALANATAVLEWMERLDSPGGRDGFIQALAASLVGKPAEPPKEAAAPRHPGGRILTEEQKDQVRAITNAHNAKKHRGRSEG